MKIKNFKIELNIWKTNIPKERKRLPLKMRLLKSQVMLMMRKMKVMNLLEELENKHSAC